MHTGRVLRRRPGWNCQRWLPKKMPHKQVPRSLFDHYDRARAVSPSSNANLLQDVAQGGGMLQSEVCPLLPLVFHAPRYSENLRLKV